MRVQRVEIPEKFKEMVGQLPGPRMEELITALQDEAPTAVRLNSRKNHPGLFADCEVVGWNTCGRYLPERPNFTLDPLLHAGAYYVQEASSMIHGQAIAKITEEIGNRKMRVLDMCAAPGGKTTAVIDALPEGSVVVANEIVGKRRSILKENLAKWGYPHVIVTGVDTAEYRGVGEMFDIVIVDAPCSGEGMMRKDDDARTWWSERLIAECATLQREILSNAVCALRPGGILLYSTCTFNPQEDEENSIWLREEYSLKPIDLHLEGILSENKAISTELGIPEGVRFMPHISRGEGLYICAFRKERSTTEGQKLIISPKKRGKKGNETKLPKEAQTVAKWLPATYTLMSEKEGVQALSPETLETYNLLKEKISNINPGIYAADLKGRDYIPTAELAHSTAYLKESHPYVELGRDEALRYLRKEPLTLPEGIARGIVCVGYAGEELGFVKNIGNRANNLYPSAWRILTQASANPE
ncbi:MAG: hypothetical protein NC097_03695 [Clostridium sp.]|nr:rRNA cytosine-C5-methyltransferase [Prevotella sp.]MCM1428880.1 hypothetical protein [Clostridium sp.]